MCKISVIMPVYNTQESYLRAAIESILNQTHKDFEFLIIDDGSTTNIKDVVLSYKDSRIKYIYQENTGIVGALNNGLENASGEYIARMDSDDISESERFEKQINYLEQHKEVGLCGTCVEEFDETGIIKPLFSPFKEYPDIIDILFEPIVCHPTAMFRTSVLKNNDIKYSNEYPYAEDQDMWHKIIKCSKVCVLQEKLLRYRRHENASSNVNSQKGINSYNKVKIEILKEILPDLNIDKNNFNTVILDLLQKYYATKKYKNIVLLGENCELAYQYVKNLGDPDSGLFNWSFVFDKTKLLNLICNPENIDNSTVNYRTNYAMIAFNDLGCSFHCKKNVTELTDKNGKPDLIEYKKEEKNLREKNRYLAKKLQKIYKSNNSKLFIYKAQLLSKENVDDYIEFLNKLSCVLNKKTKNYKILFIVTKEFYSIFHEHYKNDSYIYIRQVNNFTEIGDAVNNNVTDNEGWSRIFEEFCPNNIKKHSKVYKYENKKSMGFWQILFSVINSDKHKIITLLGIKIKIKRRKKIKDVDKEVKELRNNLNNYVKIIENLVVEKNYLKTCLNNLSNQYSEKINDLYNISENLSKQNNIVNLSINLQLMKKHLENIKHKVKYNKNGLLTYSYNNGENDSEYYNTNIDCVGNIGDYIQSLAAQQYFLNIDEYIDRDLISLYNRQNINLIMNAWWFFWRKNKNLSEKINPLFVSFHINNQDNISKETMDYLKRYEPIGCRDLSTMRFLIQNGIEAYFSGCLTLTLGNTFKIKNETERENLVYYVDYDENQNAQIQTNLSKILQQGYKDFRIENVHHNIDIHNSPEKNLLDAKNLLYKYARAKLVVTTRLHCALPCLSMGTPVIFIINSYDSSRFEGLEQLLNVIGYNEHGQFINRVNLNQNNNVYNSNDYKLYADYLTNICTNFVQQEKKDYNYSLI